ncbi:hypothetical protein ABTW72_03405 [Micromonospora sp. NPDC127501]|uniref:hypothetical protein n=1 Tax=Micromonospora sp. NPDC127501 TaxID=3154872 RepID=UPI00332657D3
MTWPDSRGGSPTRLASDGCAAPPVVVAEIAMVLAALAGATVLARRLSLREGRTASDTSHPDATRVKPA